MASYNVRLYSNTGFNGVNIPDSPALLNKCDYIDLDNPVMILQNRGLTEVIVKATWAQVENVDYVKIGDWYYSVPAGGAKMVSVDTCRLALISDPITSAHGFTVAANGTVTTNFDILDGITQRCTVKSDAWGEYTSIDPLIVPQRPLNVVTMWGVPNKSESDYIFLESTINVPAQGGDNAATTYTDKETGEVVTVPRTIAANDPESGSDCRTFFNIDGETVSDGTAIFQVNDSTKPDGATVTAGQAIERGLQKAQALGIAQGSILNQWRVPGTFISQVNKQYSIGNTKGNALQKIQAISGISGGSFSAGISPDYATVKNKRLLYGIYNKYGMITCAGNSAEFSPEDLGGENTPTVDFKADPRPNGKPYYRFHSINNNTDFWRNCLAGSEWENVPLVYQGAAGSALNRLNFDNDRKIKSLDKSQYEENYAYKQIDTALNGLQNMTSAASSGMLTGGVVGGILGATASAFNTSWQMVENDVARNQYEQSYRAQKANELSGLYQSTDVYAPSVNFPYNADILRDVKNNGVLIYKYELNPADISRIDTLLTMYGYQTAERLTPSNFGRRKHFDYVSCSTVSITGLPKWWCEEIATQLKVGVRVWHELPNTSAYSNNPIRS